jgi:hypothetical protein
MNVYTINNVFLQQEIKRIKKDLDSSTHMPDPALGRDRVEFDKMTDEFRKQLVDKVSDIVLNLTNQELVCDGFYAVRYSNKHGKPNLPPHFDGDKSDFVFSFQLPSNSSWGFGLGLKVHELENNSAILFNPNKNIHWRPHKRFRDVEYLDMIFFRFISVPANDYSHVSRSEYDPVFKDVRDYRDSLV